MPRKRSPPPFVYERPGRPEKGEAPHVRWQDPHTKKWHTRVIPEGLEGRAKAKWLGELSRDLQKRRLDSQPPPGRGVTIADAIEKYFRESPELAPQTVKTYRGIAKKLTAWGKDRYTGDLDLAALRGLRVALATPGQSPHTWNSRLAAAKSVLNFWRKAGLCPRLNSDLIGDGLELFPAPKPAPPFALAPQIRAQLAVEMDDEERALVQLCLFGGLRLAEAVRLRWAQVDLESDLLRLDATTKARRWRLVDLRVSPMLLETLKALPREGALVLPSFLEDTRHRRVRHLRKRLPFGFQDSRVTCSTYLTNAPGIFGERSLWAAAKTLGHSPQVAEENYAGHLPRLSADARTLEAAMGVKIK